MFAKLAVLIVGLTCIAAGLMFLRQHKMEVSHDIAQAHRQINDHRQMLWRLQGQVAQKVQPPALIDAVAQAQLELEPITTVRPTELPQNNRHQPRVVQGSSTFSSGGR